MQYKWWMPSKVMPSQPWIHPDAVTYLESILHHDMVVCEFGGGGSSVWLGERVKRVVTYEPNKEWLAKINLLAPENVTLKSFADWQGDVCDLLFLDGEPLDKRAEWIAQAHKITSEWVVLDNANRPEYKRERDALGKYFELVHTVNGNEGVTLYLVTEFWRMR